jgi:hypothetical protein
MDNSEIIRGDIKQAVNELNRLIEMHYEFDVASFRVCDLWRINKQTLRDAYEAQYQFTDKPK